MRILHVCLAFAVVLACCAAILFSSKPVPSVASASCEQPSGAYGKVAGANYEVLGRVGPVIFISQEGQIYSAPVERGGYTLELPACTRFRAGVLTFRGYYFETVNIRTTGDGDSTHVDFIGVAKQSGSDTQK